MQKSGGSFLQSERSQAEKQRAETRRVLLVKKPRRYYAAGPVDQDIMPG